jgi:hypothetical protein
MADGSCLLSFGGGTVTASVTRPAEHLRRFGRLWWLPAGGLGNGLDDDSWAPLLEVNADVVGLLLEAFRIAGVPAHAALAHPTARRLAASTPAAWWHYRVWAGASAYGRAEATVLAVMPALSARLRERGSEAWS